MNPPVEKEYLQNTRTESIARWMCWLMFIAGSIALAFVVVTLIDARLYQVSAKHSLDSRIQMVNVRPSDHLDLNARAGDVVGRIDIPRLGVSVAVLEGTTSRTLRRGAGHVEGTPLPGEPGNSGLAGHRDTFFRELRNIRETDEIQLQTAHGVKLYEVDWFKIVEANDTSVLRSSSDESTLTLVTCYPFYFVGSAPKRFVVHARRR